MTDKPDRQDGDGLRTCPCCAGASSFAEEWPGHLVACENARCGIRSGIFPTKPMARRAWNTRPPTRDGAEGAGQNEIHSSDGGVGSQTRKELSADAQSLMAAGNVDSLGVAPGPSDFSSAPPKPAPDAMRESCPSCGSSSPHMHPAVQHEGEVELCTDDFHLRPTNQNTPKYIAAVEAKRALSAPVPPADGAADKIIGEIENRFPNWRSYRDLIDCIDVTLHELRSGLSWPSPSPAVAAEPDAWGSPHVEYSASRGQSRVEYWVSREDGKLIEDGCATPPVRGDRKAIAEIAGAMEDLANDIDPEAAALLQDLADKLSALSLPVQPGAGEREAIAEACVRRLARCNINNLGQREMAADDILSTLQKIEAVASHQAPHSSSEGER